MDKQNPSMVELDDYVLWFGEQALELRQYKSEYQKLALDLGTHKELVQKLNESLSELHGKLRQAEESNSAKVRSITDEATAKTKELADTHASTVQRLNAEIGRLTNQAAISVKDASLVAELKSKYDQCRRVSDEQAEKLKSYAARINKYEQELIDKVAEIAALQAELSAKTKKPKKKVKK